MFNKGELEARLNYLKNINPNNCTMWDLYRKEGMEKSIIETAIHYLTLSEQQTKVLESAKELLGDALTDYPVSLGYRAVVIKVITAIEELSDNG